MVKPSPQLLSDSQEILKDLIELGCPHVHKGEDPEQFCSVLLAGRTSSDRNDIIRWFALKLIGEKAAEIEIQHILETIGIPHLEWSSENDTIDIWRLLITCYRAKCRTEDSSYDATKLIERNRHYLDFVVHNVFSIQNENLAVTLTIGRPSRVLHVPRDVLSDLRAKAGPALKSIPIGNLLSIKSSIEKATQDELSEIQRYETSSTATTQNDTTSAPNLSDTIDVCRRSFRDADASFHTEFKSLINAQDTSGMDEKDRKVENSVDKMFENVEKIYQKHQNTNTLRTSAAQVFNSLHTMQK